MTKKITCKALRPRRVRRASIGVIVLLLLLPAPTLAETARDRFFLIGDGKLHIRNLHNGKETSTSFLSPDGSLNEDGLARIDDVFGFPTRAGDEHIAPRLLAMLDYFSDLAAPGKVIKLVSGYRSPGYNTTLRDAGGNVAKTSAHMDGMAIDFKIDGVNGKKLWTLIRSRDCCGVGYYGGPAVHLDAGRPRFWEAATSKVRTGESDFNRRIYAATDFDRYKPGDTVRLTLLSVSDFGFGVRPEVSIVGGADEAHVLGRAAIRESQGREFALIGDREAARHLSVVLSPELPAGRCRIRIEFCHRPFEEMVLQTVSNEIEITGRSSSP